MPQSNIYKSITARGIARMWRNWERGWMAAHPKTPIQKVRRAVWLSWNGRYQNDRIN